ncbi:MAG: vWA domain-containing protein, partial [bacterium]
KPDEVCHLTNADNHGKVHVGNAIWGITTGGSTAFLPALESAASLLGKEAGRKKVIVFFTDGEDGGPSPIQFAQGLSAQGVTLFVGGLGVSNTGEILLEAMSGANFKSLNNASEVTAFFASAQAQAASAVVTNAQLRLTPVNFATIMNFELVTRGGQPNYVPADNTGKLVPLGDISVGDIQQAYLGLQVVLPEDIKAGRRSFGKIELIGDVPSDGRKGVVLTTVPIAVSFSDQPVPGMNEPVRDMINVAATAREMSRFAQTGDQAHLVNARRTVAFSNSAVAAALAAQINQINAP